MIKRLLLPLLLSILLAAFAIPVLAQSPTPSVDSQPVPTGEVTGSFINRSTGGIMPESLSVMLHILDQNYTQVGMLHTQSEQDGSFRFEEVPLNPGEFYAGIVTYKGATYYSEPVPYNGITSPNIEIPIYETTNDLSQVQVDEMHVLFNFAQDGIEVSEIYLLSNLGDRTITGTLTLTDGQPATLEFPLPAGADYVFFKPDSADRFVKLPDGFADKAPLIPGKNTSQIMVSYLAPYRDEMTYSYTAPIAIGNIDYLLPAEEGVILSGQDLQGPELTTLQDNSMYQVYTYKGLSVGQTVKLDFLGKPNIESITGASTSHTKPGSLPLNWAFGIGAGVFGVVMIGVGVWQWRRTRQDDTEVDADNHSDISGLNEIVVKIAQLDEAYDSGKINETDYRLQREALKQEAKTQLDETAI